MISEPSVARFDGDHASRSRAGEPDVSLNGILAVMTAQPGIDDVVFSRIKIRTGALVFCDDDVALIRRDRGHSVHYTPPGGNVEPGEGLLAALERELIEELGLDIRSSATPPQLLWVVDQMVTRPGPTVPPRKLHLIYRTHVTSVVRARMAGEEYDELPDGGREVGVIEWIDYRETADLPIFPPIGPALAALPSPRAAVPDAALSAVDDANYTWV